MPSRVEGLRISDELLASVEAHAREAFPHECCGYLRGTSDEATELVRCHNAQADGEHPTHPERGPETGFVIAGAELFEFARAFRTARPPIVVYHSHTNGRAYFSDVDRSNAMGESEPTYPVQYLVVGVTAKGVEEAAIYAWNASTGDFDEVARFGRRC